MNLTKKQLDSTRKMIKQMTEMIEKQSNCCFIMSNPTRIKVLVTINQHRQICVSEIAEIVQISVSAVSHQLKKLESFGSVVKNKKGQEVLYSLNKKNHVVHCLYNFQKQRI